MAKQQDPKKKAEELKDSFEDLSLSIKDLGKELSKIFETKKLDNFVKSLTAGFEDTIDYSDQIQDKIVDMGKSVTTLTKEFGSLRGELNSFSKDISNIKIPTLKIESNINVEDIELPSVENINATVKFNVDQLKLPKIEDINANVKFNVQPIDIPKIEDINANVKFNVQDIELPEFNNVLINAKLNKLDLSELDKMPILELMAEIDLVDTSLLDKTIDRYNPIILSSIIDTPDTSLLSNIAKNTPVIQLQTEVTASNATDQLQEQVTETDNITENINLSTKSADKMQKRYEEILKKIKQGGDNVKLTNSEMKFLVSYGEDAAAAMRKVATESLKDFDSKKELSNISKQLISYDSARIANSGLIKNGLIDQIDKTKFLENVSNSLIDTETNLNTVKDLSAKEEERINALKAAGIQTTSKSLPILNEINKLTNQSGNAYEDIAKSMIDVESSASKLGTAEYRNIDLSSEIFETKDRIRKLELQRQAVLDDSNGIVGEERAALLLVLDTQQAIVTEQLKQFEAVQKTGDAYDAIQSKAQGMADVLSQPVDKLFGIVPDNISKMLGLDKIQSELKDKLFKSITDGFMSAGGGVTGFFSAAASGAATLMTSLLPILPILLAIAGVVGLVKLFLDADAAVGELAKNLNLSYQEATKVYSTANDIAGELGQFGVSTSDVTKQMVELQKVMGVNLGTLSTTNAKAKEFLETSTLLSKRYGTTAEENAQLNSAAAITGTTMDKMALTVEAMSKDGLVPAGELMKDIGKVSKGVLFNFKGNVVALAKAVKQAKLMGTTLDKMNAVGENLMNIESQIAAQNKARIMLGKNINMDAARYFYMTGQTEKMMDAMVQQMGSAAEYEKLGPYQRKLYAEAMGMGVDQLDEMMAKQKELETIGLSQTELQEMLNASTKEGFDMEKALSKVSAGKARDMLKEKLLNEQNLSTQEKLAAVANKFKTALFKAIEPLLPAIESFVNSLLESDGPVQGILSTFKSIGSILGTVMEISMNILRGAWYPIGVTIDVISYVFDKISKVIKFIKEDIFGIKDATGDAGEAAKETGKSMEIIKYVALAIGNIIGGWFILKTLSKAKEGLSSMYDSAKGIGSSLKDGFKSLKEGKLPSFGKKKGGVEDLADKKIDTPEVDTKGADKTLKNTTSFADRLKSAFKSINDTLKAIFKGIGDMLKNIFNFVKDTVKTILDFIKNVMKDIFKTIKDVAKELTSTLQSLMQNIGDLLNTAIDVIKGVGTNLIGAVGELLGAVIEVINTQGTALVNALGNVGNALAENVMKVVNTLLDGLGQAASKLPGIMNSLGQAIGSFFAGLSTGLVTFAQAMATPTPFFGMPVGLILLGMAMGIAAALRIAAPGIAALGIMFEGLGKGIGAVAPAIEAAGTAISSILNGIGEVIESVGKAISTVITAIADSIVKFSDVDAGNIAAVGLSLGALGAGLLALTAGEVVNGIASFFGASPIDTLKELETIDGNKMKTTADGLKSMSTALSNFGNVDTEPITKSADALNKFNDQVIKGGLADALNSFLGSDPFAVFNQLAAIDTAKIDTVATSIALAGTSIETFNQKMSALDDSVADKGDIIATLLNDIADIEHDEIDALASAIDNLSKSYDNLMASMKKITDDDIARMQQIASATPKDVGGGGITDVISDTLGSAMSGVKDLASSAISSVGSFFGFGEEEPKQETQVTQTKPAITPVMQQPATVTTAVVAASEQSTVPSTQTDNKGVEALLKELISKLNQPVQLKIGDGAIRDIQSAITLNRSYTANVNGFRP